jgi:hypothetical protein
MNLVHEMKSIPIALDRVRRLAKAIKNRECGTSEALIWLYETQPEELWEQANRSGILTPNEWTACLAVLSKWRNT